MTSLTADAPTLAASLAELAASKSIYRLADGRVVVSPLIVRDTVYLTHRTQPAAAKPMGGQTKLMAPRSGTSTPRDSVEILSFLTGAATVNAIVGGTAKTYQVRAGLQAQLYPLANGTNKVSVVRSGTTTATVTSPWTVVAAPVVQDLQYHAVSSGR